MSSPVYSVLGDRGGAEAVGPVLLRLRSRGDDIVVAAVPGGPGAAVGQAAGFQPAPAATTAEQARVALATAAPRALITGTSWGADRPELPFLDAARSLGIPSLAILDFWSNYAERFLGPGGRVVLPDEIAVMDSRARTEAVQAGLPAGRLAVTGNPHFEGVLARFAGFDREARLSFRERVGLSRRDTVVLFCLQPLRALYGGAGPTEVDVLEAVREGLDQVAGWLGHAVVLAVRPHPRDPVIPPLETSAEVAVRPALGHDAIEWALGADLVVGMTSAVLVHAALLGGRVLTIRPGRGRGWTAGPVPGEAVSTLPDVPAALYRTLARPARGLADPVWMELRARAAGATERVIARLDRLVARAGQAVAV